MDAGARRPQLPALGFLDNEKSRREEEMYQSRITGAQQPHIPAVASSPSYQYPAGPPPPYSHPAPTIQRPRANSAVHTPPDSRRTSGDDQDAARQSVRQSLPSISEALGVDNQASYPGVTSAPAPSTTAPSAHLPPPLTAHTGSPSIAQRKPYAQMDPPPPQSAYVASATPYQQPAAYAQPPYAPPEPHRHTTSLSHGHPLAHDAPTSLRQPDISHSPSGRLPPPPSAFAHPQPPTSMSFEQHDAQQHPPAASSNFQYGYAQYPSRYNQPAAPAGTSGMPIYQPSTTNAAPTTIPSWKVDSSRPTDDRAPLQHTESVKRQLDFWELGAALDEIRKTSETLLGFSERYGVQFHNSARSGPALSSLPSVPELEEMLVKTRVQADSLARVRDVVLAQHAAYDQQVAEQHQQRKAFESMPPPSEVPSHDADDTKAGGFAGSDTKKRRGRAAPPGRCHSCNRAETPEWRRGPDGARTLCNACGLHYAKLTRKQNQQNKQASAGSSNIRPKERGL